MQPRLNIAELAPEAYRHMMGLERYLAESPLPKTIKELVKLRVSQINGCAPCTYAGVQAAKKQGETDDRLHTVGTWRETPFFTEPERAALALAEAATRIEDGQPGVTDEIWAAAAGHFDDRQLSAIVTLVALTGFFNRVNRAIREQAGKTW